MIQPSKTSWSKSAMAKTALKVFFAALIIRWTYSVVIFLTMGNSGLMGVDSSGYVSAGSTFAASLRAGSLHGWQWLGPNPYMMPFHTWLVGIAALAAGQYAALCDVLAQGALDAGTCFLIYAMAKSIDPRYATAAAIAAAINPTQIVISGIVYPDTAFLFFAALFLFGALRWLQSPSWPYTVLIALGLSCAALIRILVVPFAFVLVIFLAVAISITGRFHQRQILQLGTMLLIFVLSVAPISIRNATVYGTWALTPQTGMHLARWIVPLTWEVRDGTPWARGYAEMERRAAELPHSTGENVFQLSQRYTEVALDELRRIGPSAIVKAWLIGAALNLGTPAIILAPPVAQLPRTGFYATQGKSILAKIGNFLFRSDNIIYGWILLTGTTGVLFVRILQFAGFATMLRHRHWMTTGLLTVWCLFILTVNGPVASPKYRLPMEPALMVTIGAGWVLLRRVKPQQKDLPS
jgi:hypothetical protein